jgi:N6-adenosine-specific RNA methylase IME4
MTNLGVAVRKIVPTVTEALKTLVAMERQLAAAKTYDEIRRVIKEATALKVLMSDVEAVKAAAEDAILVGYRRIAEELRKVPKATYKGGPKKQSPTDGKSVGRESTGISHSTRSRLGKLADRSPADLKATANKLRADGKDATPNAVVREITQGDKKERRSEREQALAKKIVALPDQRYGVIVADPEWRFEPWSRETGMDRAADNHYPTSTLEVIKARDVPSIAAKDCVLFLWATAPMLPHALAVMEAWGSDYKSQVMWRKIRVGKQRGTGYWFINEHELLLVGTRGNVPAPAQGTQWPSVIDAPVGEHSEKPEIFLELIEAYFPNLPKIELNRRGSPRGGWFAWGNEVQERKP